MKHYCILFIIIFSYNLSLAQLSPGKLQKVHSHLEGLENCTQCHEYGKKVASIKCLQCHAIIKQRIEINKGLHVNPDYKDCVKCHVDHQGLNYELVYWKEGKENFDHSLTGYELLGKHKIKQCEKCHRPEHISDKKLFQSKKKDLNRTLLGLNQKCLSCHLDEHRGQTKNSCLSCHSMDGWNPPINFDHNKTEFRLTGKHQNLKCEKCHKIIHDNKFDTDKDFMNFQISRFERCLDCHQDVHHSKFGQNCESCHNTSGWKNYNQTQFDHEKTEYPLRGKHNSLKCKQCHLPGNPLKITKFKKCKDCHKDYHQGQLAQRTQAGACQECHTVDGFSPSLFTINLHSKTKYPLKGSHLAIPCFACHPKINRGTRLETIQFRFRSTSCLACHKDPHFGEVDKYIKKDGCEFCHTVDSWRIVSYDHSKTRFPLQGRHQKTGCAKCHKTLDNGKPSEHLQFLKLNKLCQWCHKDEHLGQFRDDKIYKQTKKNFTRCERCHTPVDWLAEKFNHDRDSNFKLEGAHEAVKCEACHKKVVVNSKEITCYKPLDSGCKSCHGNEKIKPKNVK